MPLPCVCINLAASLRAAPASTSRPVNGASQVGVQQKSPAVSQFRPPALCFAVAPRRAALIEAYRAAERVDGTGTRIARGAKRVFVGIFHRPAALTRARPFVTLGAIWAPGVGRI